MIFCRMKPSRIAWHCFNLLMLWRAPTGRNPWPAKTREGTGDHEEILVAESGEVTENQLAKVRVNVTRNTLPSLI